MTCGRCLKSVEHWADHGLGVCPLVSRQQAQAVIDDQLPGGARFIENLGNEPVWVETKTQLKQELDARGLEPMVRHVDGDQHVGRWVSVDLTNYDDPDIKAAREREMAAFCGLTVERYRELLGRPVSGVIVGEAAIEQAPVIERYTRVTDETFTVSVPR